MNTETGEVSENLDDLVSAAIAWAVEHEGVAEEHVRVDNFDAEGEGIVYIYAYDPERKVETEISSIEFRRSEEEDPRWSDYKLPHGENYREILFTLPGSEYTNRAMSAHWGRPGVLAHARVQDMTAADGGKVLFVEEIQSDWHNEGRTYGYANSADRAQYEAEMAEVERQKDELRYELTDGDMAPVVRVLARARFSGNMQSAVRFLTTGGTSQDYFTAVITGIMQGNNPGNYPTQTIQTPSGEIETVSNRGAEYLKSDINQIDDWKNRWSELAEKYFQLRMNDPRRHAGEVPDAPFSKNYHEYVMKNLLREAAENGYDYVAWTTGRTQEERWSSDYAEG